MAGERGTQDIKDLTAWLEADGSTAAELWARAAALEGTLDGGSLPHDPAARNAVRPLHQAVS